MKRPCACNRFTPGEPYSKGDCRLCWLYAHDERYTKLWTGEPDPPKPEPSGPGTELKNLLLSLKLIEKYQCNCGVHVNQMNEWGVEGCREHFDEIVEWLNEAAKKASWFDKLRAGTIILTFNLPINLIEPAESLVQMAIARAETTGNKAIP